MLKTRLKDHFKRPNTPTNISTVKIESNAIEVHLSDGRVIRTPLEWFPVLNRANQTQREKFRISPRGIHWDELDEDIPIETFLDDYK